MKKTVIPFPGVGDLFLLQGLPCAELALPPPLGAIPGAIRHVEWHPGEETDPPEGGGHEGTH